MPSKFALLDRQLNKAQKTSNKAYKRFAKATHPLGQYVLGKQYLAATRRLNHIHEKIKQERYRSLSEDIAS